MQVTLTQCDEILQKARLYSGEKWQFAVKRFRNQAERQVKRNQKQLEETRIDLCSVDKDGNVLKDEKGGFLFTKENLKALAKANSDMENSLFDIEIHYATEVPANIDEEDLEIFKGVLIDPSYVAIPDKTSSTEQPTGQATVQESSQTNVQATEQSTEQD